MSVETKLDLTDETIEALQDLVQINRDSEKGFLEAAEQVSDESVAGLFRSLASERSANAADLARYVAINGEKAASEGSYLAAFHRTWLDLRSALNGGDAHVILSEAERGEDHIKHAYEDALKQTAGSAMNDVLTSQYANVKAGHDKVRDLRDGCKC